MPRTRQLRHNSLLTMKRTDVHASRETLALYVLGDLPLIDTIAVQEHLLFCPLCVERLPEMRALVAAFRSVA
jgi:anti-sigma factor RsiW